MREREEPERETEGDTGVRVREVLGGREVPGTGGCGKQVGSRGRDGERDPFLTGVGQVFKDTG